MSAADMIGDERFQWVSVEEREPAIGQRVLAVRRRSDSDIKYGRRHEFELCVRQRVGDMCRDEKRDDAQKVVWYRSDYQSSYGYVGEGSWPFTFTHWAPLIPPEGC